MPGDEKLIVKIQIRISEEEKKNLDKNIPILAKQLKDQIGTMITRSDFLRLVLEDLHEKISRGDLIQWPPRLILSEQPQPSPARPKKKKGE